MAATIKPGSVGSQGGDQHAILLADEYQDVEELILSIDGLQPEKGHETLYVVRELTRKRVWFAESPGTGGGYILGPAHLFQVDVPPENVLAAYRGAL